MGEKISWCNIIRDFSGSGTVYGLPQAVRDIFRGCRGRRHPASYDDNPSRVPGKHFVVCTMLKRFLLYTPDMFQAAISAVISLSMSSSRCSIHLSSPFLYFLAPPHSTTSDTEPRNHSCTTGRHPWEQDHRSAVTPNLNHRTTRYGCRRLCADATASCSNRTQYLFPEIAHRVWSEGKRV